MQKRKKKTR